MLATLARFAVRRRRTVILAWVALLVALGAAVGALGTGFTDDTTLPSSDSATAYALLGAAGSDAASGTPGTIVWQSAQGATGAAARADIVPMLAAVAAVPGVVAVSSPFDPAGAAQVSADGRTAFARVTFHDTDHAEEAKTLAEDASTIAVRVQTGGTAFTDKIPSEVGEIVGVLAALLVLLLVFRSAWAAALPVVTGVAGVALSTVTVMLLSHVIAMSTIVMSMSALIGLGVGIDYALFIVHRHRKALRDGADVATATATAMSTSGRAVLFAGATVIVALLGMLVLGVGFLTGIAVAAAVTVLLTVVAATTLLPAMLGVAGVRVLRRRDRDDVRAGFAPGAFEPVAGPRGAWAAWARLVRRRPALTALASLVVLVTLALPAVALRLGASDASSDPAGSVTRTYHDTMAAAFGEGFESQLLLVAETPDAASTAAWTALVDRLPGVAGVAGVSPAVPVGPGLSTVAVTPTTTAQDAATSDLVATLRSDLVPGAEAGTALQVHVGGTTATTIDFSDALTSKLPLFLVIIGVLGFLLLMVAFRSLLVPTIGALGNLLTIAVALGASVAIFQWGWGPALFGIGGGAPLEYVVAMLIVGVVFGLSMDYHVFLVSRMHEEWTHTGDHERAVDAGVSDTGQVVATAATIMGLVFASFGFAGMRTASEFGVGLAVAVLADAFVLRLTLVPALMHLLGRRTWALPPVLDRVLPHVSVEGAEPAPAAVLPAPVPVGGRSR